MPKSATDVIQDIINAAVVDAIVALKDEARGLPNALLRDVNAIHSNTAFADLPPAIQKAVAASVRSAFSKLQKEGYVVSDAKSVRPVTVARPPIHAKDGGRPGERRTSNRPRSPKPTDRKPR